MTTKACIAVALLVLTGCPAEPGVADDADNAEDAYVEPDGSDADASADAEPDAGSTTPQCPTVGDGTAMGLVTDLQVAEVSGLAASRSQPGVIWVHNDSGGAARVFAVDTTGTLRGTYNLSGAYAWDYEDIAADDEHLFVADIGDNYQIREYVTVYRVAEPEVDLTIPGSVTADLAGVDGLEFVYPDGPHDAETLIVDPVDGDLLIVTKQQDGDASVFRAASPHDPNTRVTLELVTTLPLGSTTLPGGDKATGGDVTPDGDRVILRSGSSAWLWTRPEGGALWESFSQGACVVSIIEEPNGEAIGFDCTASGYFTLSEGTSQPLYYFSLELDALQNTRSNR